MDCRQVESLLPAYALSALEGQEERAVEEHLSICPWCASILNEQIKVATALAGAAHRHELPSDLKSRLMRQVQDRPGNAGKSRKGPRVLTPTLLAASMAAIFFVVALVAVSVLIFGEIDDLQEDTAGLTAQLSDLAAEDQQLMDVLMEQRSISYIMASPSRQMVPLEGPERVSGAQGILLISSPNSSTALLMAKGLEPLAEGHSYYVWLSGDSEPTTMGTLTVDSHGWGVLSLGPSRSISFFQNVWITDEPASEVATSAPSGTPVLWGNISGQ